MKQLICEMCGSADLVKQNGLYICQSCGTRYSVEEAKKMMFEGTIDVSGSAVKVDNSDELKNLYIIARRAKDDNNFENAAKYYDMILVKDPNSWEANFYLPYFKAMGCEEATQIESVSISFRNNINTVLKLIKDHVEGKEEQEKAVRDVALRCMTISLMLYSEAKADYEVKSKYTSSISDEITQLVYQNMVNGCYAATDIMYVLGNCIDSIFVDYENLHSVAVSAWKDGITKHEELMEHFLNKELNKNIIMEYVAKVQKYDSSYQAPTINIADNSNTSSGGCYVATAVYGSYDCPQVWTLRRYRDYTLAETWYGRVFIHTYYAISSTLVKQFGHTEWFKKMWKSKLDRMVANLMEEGVEDTPYEDRKW
jgi:tetratricopeptide (TPR) repeat protein